MHVDDGFNWDGELLFLEHAQNSSINHCFNHKVSSECVLTHVICIYLSPAWLLLHSGFLTALLGIWN